MSAASKLIYSAGDRNQNRETGWNSNTAYSLQSADQYKIRKETKTKQVLKSHELKIIVGSLFSIVACRAYTILL